MKKLLVLFLTLALAACATLEKPPVVAPPPVLPLAPLAPLQSVGWEAVAGWPGEDLSAVWDAFKRSCVALHKRQRQKQDE